MVEIPKEIQDYIEKRANEIATDVYERLGTKYGVASIPTHNHTGADSVQLSQSAIIPSLVASGRITMSTNGQRYYLGLNTKPGFAFSSVQIRYNGIVVATTTTFTVTAASATAGAVYTNNGQSFMVIDDISGGTTLVMSGSGQAGSGTLTKTSGTGDSSITFSSATTTANSIRALVEGDAYVGSSFYLQPATSASAVIGGTPQIVVQSSSYLLINDSGDGPITQALSSEGHVISIQFNGVIVYRATFPDFGDFGSTDSPLQSGSIVVDVTLQPGWSSIGSFVFF